MIKRIKELVETETGLQDIGIKKRTIPYVEARVLYSNLALNHTKFTTERIGAEINRSHCTIVHHKKLFKQWLQHKKFYSEYLRRYKTLKSIVEEDIGVDTNPLDLYRKYKKENIILQTHNNELIKKLNEKQKELEEKAQSFINAKSDASYWLTLYKRLKDKHG